MVISGIIGGLVATALTLLAKNRPKPAELTEDGWYELSPGNTLHFVVVGCSCFVGGILYFFALGGSSRSDAEEQNIWALILLLAFGAAGLAIFWLAYLRKFQWRDDKIRIVRPFARDIHYRIADIVDLREGYDASELKLKMEDGRTWRVSVYQRGFGDFVQNIFERSTLFREEAGGDQF